MTTTTTPRRRVTLTATTATTAAVGLALAGCSAIEPGASGGSPSSSAGGGTVTLVTHDAFALPDELIARFEADTGLTLEQTAPGDGGSLVNQLVLTKGAPIGDVVFGIDTTFASRAVEEGVLEEYDAELPEGVEDLAVVGDHLTPVDVGDVCINADLEWFADKGVPAPTTLTDLTKPAYRDLLVVTNPATSSPGLAFLLATVAEFGEDGWKDYWEDLKANGAKVVDGWEDAYYVDFSGPSSEGDRPLVLSYASSPPYEVPEGGDEAPTAALLDTCFRVVEYAGVLAGADNPEGARQVIDWLLSPEVQAAVPENMYMFPADPSVELPPVWARFAPLPEDPARLDADLITDNRQRWITEWTEVVVG